MATTGTFDARLPAITGITSTNPFVQIDCTAMTTTFKLLGVELGQEASLGPAQLCLIVRKRSTASTLPTVPAASDAFTLDKLNTGNSTAAVLKTGLAMANGADAGIIARLPFYTLGRGLIYAPIVAPIFPKATCYITLEFAAAPPAGTIWSGQIEFVEA